MRIEQLRVLRETLGPWRFLRMTLVTPMLIAAVAFALNGPTLGARIFAGLIAVVCVYAVYAGVYLYFSIKNRTAFKKFEAAHDRANAMSFDEAREAALTAIGSSGLYRAYPATGTAPPGLPAELTDFFDRFDRLDLVLPGNPSPQISLDRCFVGPVPDNPDAIKIGELYPSASCMAYHIPTRSVTGQDKTQGPGWVGRMVKFKSCRHSSIWHVIALMAEWRRIGDEAGFAHPVRYPRLDDRPKWRALDTNDLPKPSPSTR